MKCEKEHLYAHVTYSCMCTAQANTQVLATPGFVCNRLAILQLLTLPTSQNAGVAKNLNVLYLQIK